MKKKFLSKDIQLNFLRENRKYLHSTDIFEKILFINKSNLIKNLNISFIKPILNENEIIIQSKFSKTLKAKSSLYFEYEIKKNQFFGFLIELKKKLTKKKKYDENKIKKKSKFDKKNIIVPNLKEFNFIELIIACAMKFLKKKSPETISKWYLAKINLFSFSYQRLFKKSDLVLEIDKVKSTIYNFKLYLKNKKIGSMVFIKT